MSAPVAAIYRLWTSTRCSLPVSRPLDLMGVTGRACANTCLASPFQCFRASMNGAQRPEVAAPSARQACLLCGPKVSRGLNEFPDSESAPIYGTRQTHSHVHGMAVGGGEWFDEFPRVSSSCLNSRWRVDSNASGWRELVTACKGGVWWKGAIEREGVCGLMIFMTAAVVIARQL